MNIIFLDQKWQNQHYDSILKKAGSRYTPHLNVELPISKIFNTLSRTKEFYVEFRTHVGELNRSKNRAVPREKSELLNNKDQDLFNKIDELQKHLSKVKEYNNDKIPLDEIRTLTNEAQELVWEYRKAIYEAQESEKEKAKTDKKDKDHRHYSSDIFNSELHYLTELQRELNYFSTFAQSKEAELTNNPNMSLLGRSGIGKTHLLCDLVKIRFKSGYPTIMLLGQDFQKSRDIASQIISQLNLTKQIKSNKDLFSLLDKAGESSNCRTLILIDALNETPHPRYWITNLKKFIDEVKHYKNIALVVSVRSGFEKEIYTNDSKKLLVKIEHEGFSYREWEAVVTFFSEYKIPLPEIPILNPEFQIPLFLKLFCEGVGNRLKKNKGKQSFKGHEGATFIFETYIKAAADKIAKEHSLPKGRNSNGEYVIWDTIIEKIAEVMIRKKIHKDLIFPHELKKLIVKAHPSVNPTEMINSLERNTLLTKIPVYSPNSTKVRYGYRFPYQKFSDHLICRYLLKKYDPKDPNFNKLFSRKKVFGKLLRRYQRGILEALAIQIPERTKGKELFDFFSRDKNNYLIKETFLESIIWRIPTKFRVNKKGSATKALKYVNKYLLNDEYFHQFLNVVISVSPNPLHPINALSLHRYLNDLGIKKRDAWWSTFLHYQNGEKGAVDRIIEWAWSMSDKQKIDDNTTELAAITLTWFLTTPNRYIRDKSTKALVALLTNKLNVVCNIIKRFRDVDDFYVLERIYAVAYGTALRCDPTNNNELKKLAELIYDLIFKDGSPPPHFLLRDYAQGVIKETFRRGIKLKFDPSKVEPPYKSDPPDTAPNVEDLKKKYYPDDFSWDKNPEGRGIVSIWSSLMYASAGGLADFGNYELGSALNHWYSRKLSEPTPLTREEKKERFEKSLSSKQKDLYLIQDELKHKALTVSISSIFKKDKDVVIKPKDGVEQQYDKAYKEFIVSLSENQVKDFHELENHNRRIEDFDHKLAEQWIFTKIVSDWYDPLLHRDFDSSVQTSRDRGAPKIERIGKKYQWIGMHQILARIADNYQFKGSSWSEGAVKFQGAWQTWERDIDPSSILNGKIVKPTKDEKWWIGQEYSAWEKYPKAEDWLKEFSDMPDIGRIIELEDPKGKNWLNLTSLVEWDEEPPPEEEKYHYPTRRLYFIIRGNIVHAKDKRKFIDWATKQKDFYNDVIPSSIELQGIFLKEYPFSEVFKSSYGSSTKSDWTTDSRHDAIPVPVIIADTQYSSSMSSNDASLEEGVRIYMPSRWLCENMGLTHGVNEGEFVNNKGEIIFKDPTVSSNVQNMLVADKDIFLKFLKDNNYDIVWTLLGEKNILGDRSQGYLGMTGVYYYENGKIVGSMKKVVR